MSFEPENLTFLELEVFAEVATLGSIRAVSRSLGLQASHVSKILQRVERKLGQDLFSRSATGLQMNGAGLSLKQIALPLLEKAKSLQELNPLRQQVPVKKVMSVGASSFIHSELIARAMQPLEEELGNNFRLVFLGPDEIVEKGLKGAFEIALHIGELEWTTAWHSIFLGEMEWALICRRENPMAPLVNEDEVKNALFVVPTYLKENRFVAGQDFCPISWLERNKGHQVPTALAAVQVIRYTDQIAFIPKMAAQSQLESGELRCIQVREWEGQVPRRPLYLTVRSDKVLRKNLETLEGILKQELEKLANKF